MFFFQRIRIFIRLAQVRATADFQDLTTLHLLPFSYPRVFLLEEQDIVSPTYVLHFIVIVSLNLLLHLYRSLTTGLYHLTKLSPAPFQNNYQCQVSRPLRRHFGPMSIRVATATFSIKSTQILCQKYFNEQVTT